MKLVSAAEMRRLDEAAQRDYGIESSSLMAEAGRAIALEIERAYRPEKICVVCGKGNNAGDGFVVARQFHELGREVTVVTLEAADAYTGAAKRAWDKLKTTGVSILPRQKLPAAAASADVIVDAILGTGIQGPVREEYASIFTEINESRRPVVSADVPSGLRDLEPGEEPGDCVRANVTVTIGLPKTMLLAHTAAPYVGRLVVAPINFPRELLNGAAWQLNWAAPAELTTWLPERKPDSNKGTYGSVGIIAGADSYAGASLLVARAALRTGCGLAAIYTLPALNSIFKIALPEATSVLLDSKLTGRWDVTSAEAFAREHKQNSVLTVGPGLGTSPETRDFFSGILDSWHGPMVIDADGLNLLADSLLQKVQGREDCILTPHPGEMGRLTGTNAAEVQKNRLAIARSFAVEHRITVLLKGADTLVARPDGQVWYIAGAEPALAKGGTGDVLTGAIASLFAQGIPMWQAAVLAATAHIEAARLCVKTSGARGVLASEIADAIPVALDRL